MGGYGSGRQRYRATKDTVESRCTFRVQDFRAAIRHALAGAVEHGVMRWTRLGQAAGSMGYTVFYTPETDALRLILRYHALIGSEKVQHEDAIELVPIPCNYGGRRWLLRCPRCGRRCGRLCQHGASFVCRLCANLTYRSSQEAHKHDAFYGSLAATMGVSVGELKRALG